MLFAPRSRTQSALRRLAPFAVASLLVAGTASAQQWATAQTNPGNTSFRALDYPMVFVASTGHSDPVTETAPHFGLDVLSANNPAPMGPAGGLYALMPNSGDVVKLFPLGVHESMPGLIDTPLGQLGNGAVVEPNISEDGRIVYFSWFHDQEYKLYGGAWQELRLSFKGADAYRLDLGPLIDDPALDPATLPIKRLTFKEYSGPAKTDVPQSIASRASDATNAELVQDQAATSYWGTVDMHMVEMRTATGLKAVWVSDRARLDNANKAATESNHQFGIYIADILADGSLGPVNPWQFYTTTSALSPTPMRNGISFSYQSSTEGYRRWDIQNLTSNGIWTPLIGFAHGTQLFHFGSYVVAPGSDGPLTDHFIGARYYNLNNAGMGQLHRLELKTGGTNEFVNGPQATVPLQISDLVTLGAASEDMPSAQVNVGGQLKFIGKFSTPRAGRIGGEYLATWTPTSANRWLADANGQKGLFDVQIVYRPSLEPFAPYEPVNLATGAGMQTVIDETSGTYSLLWPTPALSWEERYGVAQQEFSGSIVPADMDIERGLPHAKVGTSAIWNTDIRPYDCYLNNTGTTPFNPNDMPTNSESKTLENVDGLRYVQDPNDFCQYLLPETVLGIVINMTSQEVDAQDKAYDTNGEGTNGSDHESVEMLGLFAPTLENVSDQSFQAKIPAKVPFDFHLVDSTYGMKLVDVRSWHSLQPREARTDCGGCHQHEAGFGIPYAGTEAAQKPELDMTGQTKFVTYDQDCKPVISVSATPTVQLPEWKADIWPGIDQHCSACHDSGVSADAAALQAYSYTDEEGAYDMMKDRRYGHSSLGALGSPAFWAAYGERTDGRNNDLIEYRPDVPNGQWGYRFSSVHASNPGLCATQNPQWAEWVRKLGQWIDNHMPRDRQGTVGYKFDRYPPAVDFALNKELTRLRFGVWDNGSLVSLELYYNGAKIFTIPSQTNGAVEFPIPPGISFTDRIKAVAIDGENNRQSVEKTVLEIWEEYLLDPS